MTKSESDRNLLIGILAVQMDFINRDQLVASMQSWMLNKERPLEEHMHQLGAIDSKTRNVLLALVERHIEIHDDDPQSSLSNLKSLDQSVFDALENLSDPLIEFTLSQFKPGTNESEQHDAGDLTQTMESNSHTDANRFQRLRPHAEGGLGKVSVALDHELNREVALKEIHGRFADQVESRGRFLLEAEITGGLEHPGVVPVYGLGSFPDGRPYYAMRFIRGDSLRQAGDRFHKQRTNKSRRDFLGSEYRQLLTRFVAVCDAIEYAHSRGVLHRDLKPSNIMLGKYGETLVVDWGLSKIVSRKDKVTQSDEPSLQPLSGSQSAETQMGATVGTPQYMPPEQADGRLDLLGTTSDVYSLGATLFHLLTGASPFQAKDIESVLDAVRHGDFNTPHEVDSTIPPALNAICLRAMALAPKDRYDSPRRLADEIEHWLADESVEAYLEPVAARTWRWVRRHQAATAGIAGIVLISLCSMFVILAIIASHNRQLTIANDDKDAANQLLRIANTELEDKEREIRRERDVALAINEFVRNDLIGSASPDEHADRDLKVRTVLDHAADNVDQRFLDQPLVEAAISLTIGNSYKRLGEFSDAERFLTRAKTLWESEHDGVHPDTLKAWINLAWVYGEQGRYDVAVPLIEKAVEQAKAILTEDHHDTLGAMHIQAWLYVLQGRKAESIAIYEQALEGRLRTLGATHPQTLLNKHNLANVYAATDQKEKAEILFNELQDDIEVLGKENPYAQWIMVTLANGYAREGKFSEAEELLDNSLDTQRRVLGNEHPDTLRTQTSLATVYLQTDRLDEARELLEAVIEIRERKQGATHPDALATKRKLAEFALKKGEPDSAEDLYLEVVNGYLQVLGEEHPTTRNSIDVLAGFYFDQNRLDEAASYDSRLLDIQKRVLGNKHRDTLKTLHNLARTRDSQERFADAERLLIEVLEGRKEVLGPEDRVTLATQIELAELLKSNERIDEAAKVYEAILQTVRQSDVETGIDKSDVLFALMSLHIDHWNLSEAVPYFREYVDIMRSDRGDEDPATLKLIHQLAILLAANGQTQEAEVLYVEVLEARRIVLGETHAETLGAIYGLSNIYFNARRFAECEKLLLAAHRAVSATEDQFPVDDPRSHSKTIEELVRLYTAWGKTSEASLWKSKLTRNHLELGPTYPPIRPARPPRPNWASSR